MKIARLFSILLLVAATMAANPALAASGSPAPVKIGIIAPLSGPFSSGGKAFSRSVEIALEEINTAGGFLGHPVTVVEGDSEGLVGKARSEALRLTDKEKVSFLIGAYLSEETLGVAEVAAGRKTILLVPISATEEITRLVKENRDRYRTIFRTGYSISRWAEMISRFLESRNAASYAFIGTGIRWNRELSEKLRESLSRAGVKSVLEEFYSPRHPMIKPILFKLKEEKPDWIVLGDPGKNSVEAMRLMKETGLDIPVISVGGTLSDERVVKDLSPETPLYALASTFLGRDESSNRYFEEFKKKFGYYPSGYSDTLPGDALRILAEAVKKAGSLETEKVVETLETGTFRGIAGIYSFDENHQARWGTPELPGVILRWNGESFEIIFPEK